MVRLFLGMDLRLPGNPYCVIKQLRPNAEDPDTFSMALDLFEREAKTLGKIDHPQIPRLLDYFEDQKKVLSRPNPSQRYYFTKRSTKVWSIKRKRHQTLFSRNVTHTKIYPLHQDDSPRHKTC